MQTKTLKKTIGILVSAALAVALFMSSQAFAVGVSSSDLSVFEMNESDGISVFSVTLTPEPTDTTTTTFGTNGQCLLSYNNTAFTTGGAAVTRNGTLPMRIQPIDDDLDEDQIHTCEITFSSKSEIDPEYATPVVLTQTIKITDDDNAQLIDYVINTTTTTRLQEGDSFLESYRIIPTVTPSDPVTITAITDEQCSLVIGSGASERSVASFSQTIRAGSASGVSFTIIPVDDQEFEGIHNCTVQHSVSTIDVQLATTPVRAHTATIFDNDVNTNIPDEREYEGGLIYYKDANFDGIDDADQPGVQSFINATTQKRQAVAIVDSEGNLLPDCSFTGTVQSSVYLGGGATSSIASDNGVVASMINCEAEDVFILWIFDEYQESALQWLAYSLEGEGGFVKLPANHLVYNLGDDFTSALLIDVDEQKSVTFLQSSPVVDSIPARLDDQQVAADVANSKSQLVTVVSGITALLAVSWIVYRTFFADVDTSTKSRYPRVDKY